MSFIIKDLWQDAGAHLRGVARWIDTRRPGRGSDFLADEYRAQTRRAVEAIHPEHMRLRVVGIDDRTPTIRSYRLVREDGELPPFRPGQYVNLWVDIDGVRTHRPYSICSIPGEDHLELSVKDVPGGFVAAHLRETVQVGDLLDSSGPGCNFVHEPLADGLDLVLLAGGCGVTPFLSMVRQLASDGWPARVHLIHGCTAPDEAMDGEELIGLAAASDRFRYHTVFSAAPTAERGGLLDARRIGDLVGEVGGKTFFVCGPPAMIELCRSALSELGVEDHRVRFELPGVPQDVTAAPGWPTEIAPTDTFDLQIGDRSIPASAGEPLLCTLERHGLEIPGRCRSGECAACRTRLLSGQVYELPTAHVRESDRHYGYIHPCASYPISDLELRF
jgi:glycine betaine catabolism B